MADTPDIPIRQMRPGEWAWIDLAVIAKLPVIGATPFAVYAALAQHAASKDQTCRPSEDTIAAVLGTSTRTVERAIKTLVAEGLVACQQVRQGGRWGRTAYTLLDVNRPTNLSPGEVDRPTLVSPVDVPPSDTGVATARQICRPPSDTGVGIQEPLFCNEPTEEEPRKSAPASAGSPSNGKRIRAEDLPLPERINTPPVRQAADEWLAMRRKHRFSVRPDHIAHQYERLVLLPPNQAAACLKHSTDNGYQGLFPERYERTGHGTKQRVSDDRFEHDPDQPIAPSLDN